MCKPATKQASLTPSRSAGSSWCLHRRLGVTPANRFLPLRSYTFIFQDAVRLVHHGKCKCGTDCQTRDKTSRTFAKIERVECLTCCEVFLLNYIHIITRTHFQG
ncbi:hypothetical protein O3G_MSEX011301 [Manduca sexta]|uniref:Uncharacterized protein n=1 Tax=Manduca sexta TaxID=7130 RepID=A0A921ZK68_MANSE|nr:hypothetical protein O3G_MSEX011301 [Manduca sexta]